MAQPPDLERCSDPRSAFNRPAYRYLRQSDNVPALMTGEESGSTALVKLFSGAATWWIAEYNPGTRQAFGMVDLGYGPEMGDFNMADVVSVRTMGLPVERDLHFTPSPLVTLWDSLRSAATR